MFKLFRLTLVLTLLLSVAGVIPVAGQAQPGPNPTPQAPAIQHKVFLPLSVNNFQSFSVTGQVTDESGNPLSGVVLSSGAGMTTTTGGDGSYAMAVVPGDYSVAALKEGVGFLPPAMDLNVKENVSNLDFSGTGCADLVVNGGFDTDEGWYLQNAAFGDVISGTRSLKLGLFDPDNNASSSSSAMSDPFTIPSDAKDPMLRLWIFTQSITPASKNSVKPERQPGENFFGPDTDTNDSQVVQILNTNGSVLEAVIDFQGKDGSEWGLVQFNLAKYVGNTIRLGFSVTNDGLGGTTAMFVDNVELRTCPTVYAPEGLNASVLSPDACANQISNSGFEAWGGWNIPYTPYPAGYNFSVPYPNTVFAGSWSMRTGIESYKPWLNRYSYSDSWQTVYIPATATSAWLRMELKKDSSDPFMLPDDAQPETNLAETNPLFKPGVAWGQEPLGSDAVYVLVLNPYNGQIIQTLESTPYKKTGWKHRDFNLLAYRGMNIRIQFGTYNDGWGYVSSMYADEVYVEVCDGGLPPPSGITCLPGQTEQLVNTSFETNNGWYRPVTAYTARYTNGLWHTGARSMQTGIFNFWHNRYSYSDFGQYVYIPPGVSSATLTYWIYQFSGGGGWGRDAYDKQYLLVLTNWGYWIDTLLWNNGRNSAGWRQVVQDVTYMRGYPLRLQFGTYNNGCYGITSMFVDDVTLCTTP